MSEEPKLQRIRDPVHDLIHFSNTPFEAALWKAVQSRPFQRLRRIKQLGFSDFIFPGATHSRFAHSLGVFNTARQLMQIVKRYQGHAFDENLAQKTIAAALLHDVGHGPFSHAFESVFKELNLGPVRHELVTAQAIREDGIASILNKLGGGFANDVASIILRSSPSSIYDAVVSSQFDADRLDYIRRDRQASGSMHGVIDYEWLIANLEIAPLRISDHESAPTFVIGSKATYAAEAYITGLFHLYPTIYFHKTTRGAERLFTSLMVDLFNAVKNKQRDEIVLPSNHPLVEFVVSNQDGDSDDNRKFKALIALDDFVVWGALEQLKESSNKRIADFARRLLDRDLLKCFDLRREMTAKLLTKNYTPDQVAEMIDRKVNDAWQRLELWRRGYNDRIVLSDKYERSPYKKVSGTEGALNQIYVKLPGNKMVDLVDYSPVVRALKPFKFERFYYERDDKKAKQTLEDTVSAL